MKKSDIKELKSMLIRRLEQAENQLERKTDSERQHVHRLPDTSDDADRQQHLPAFRGHENDFIKKARLALERIEAGSYGICEGCGNPIGIHRLKTALATTKCTQCKMSESLERYLEKAAGF